MDEIRAFHDTMMLRIYEVLDHLDKNWGEGMPAPEWRLPAPGDAAIRESAAVNRENAGSCGRGGRTAL